MSNSIFRPDASYLLVGGLGGIGRAMALWMTEHGAKNLIFANRSGLSRQEARDTVNLLQQRGTNVLVYSCDVSKPEQVSALVKESSVSMPPIRGAIQSAMVLRVSYTPVPSSISYSFPSGYAFREDDRQRLQGGHRSKDQRNMESAQVSSERTRFLYYAVVNKRHYWERNPSIIRSS